MEFTKEIMIDGVKQSIRIIQTATETHGLHYEVALGQTTYKMVFDADHDLFKFAHRVPDGLYAVEDELSAMLEALNM